MLKPPRARVIDPSRRARGRLLSSLCVALAAVPACSSSENDSAASGLDGGMADALTLPDGAAPDVDGEASADDGGQDATEEAVEIDAGDSGFDAGPDPCGEVNAFVPMYGSAVATWTAQDDLGGWPDSPVVFAGSSSIRRWEGLALAYTDYSPLQRGMGGAQLAEIAYYADQLINRHNPRTVVIYAGTNDIDAGVPVGVVVDRLRCLRYRIGQQLGWTRPVLFIGVTPNPARWSEWAASAEFNAQAAGLAQGDPGLVYVDVATPFLATGSPPDASLFAADGLHLSKAGYALWNSVIRPAVEAASLPTAKAGASSPELASGTRILIDLGPSDPVDGEWTPSPDYLGQSWNNWHALQAGVEVLPGEQLVNLVTSQGDATGVDLVIAGGFLAAGRVNGGLSWPDPALLGDLAVGTATEDYFYTTGDEVPGALFLRGLDPSRSYTLRLFAARDAAEVRVTRYTVQGASLASATLQTSGAGAGQGGKTTNDDDVAVFTGVKPDAWGHVFVDVSIEQGSYGYLSLVELDVE